MLGLDGAVEAGVSFAAPKTSVRERERAMERSLVAVEVEAKSRRETGVGWGAEVATWAVGGGSTRRGGEAAAFDMMADFAMSECWLCWRTGMGGERYSRCMSSSSR